MMLPRIASIAILTLSCLLGRSCSFSPVGQKIFRRRSRIGRAVEPDDVAKIGCSRTTTHLSAASALFGDYSRSSRGNPLASQCALKVLRQKQHHATAAGAGRTVLRRRAATLLVASALLLGTTSTTIRPPPAHAAASTAAITEQIMTDSYDDLDTIVDRYVQKHMFDDDLTSTDPVASTYQEAYQDATTGRYPAALKQVLGEALGKDLKGSFKAVSAADTDSSSGVGQSIGSLLTSAVQALQSKAGLSEATATMVLAGLFVVAGPSAFLLGGMIIGGISKRNMDKVFKKRYGDTYTVDATIKQEETVEAPDDDEDDDDEDDDEEDEEDDDDNDDGDDKV